MNRGRRRASGRATMLNGRARPAGGRSMRPACAENVRRAWPLGAPPQPSPSSPSLRRCKFLRAGMRGV